MDQKGIGEKWKLQQAKKIMEVLKWKVMFQMRWFPGDIIVQRDGFGEGRGEGGTVAQGWYLRLISGDRSWLSHCLFDFRHQ